MNRIGQLLARTDLFAVAAWIALVVVGLALVYSCSVGIPGGYEGLRSNVGPSTFRSQVIWVGVGLAAAAACLLVPFRFFETFAYVLYGVSMAALAVVLVFGHERMGSRRWIDFGPVSLQPSEFAKAATIFTLARFLATRRTDRAWLSVVGVVLIVLPPFLLTLKEPDLGTSLVFLALGAPMVFWAGTSLAVLLAIVSPLISAVLMFYGQNVLGSTWPWVIYILALLGVVLFSRLYMLQSTVLVFSNLTTGLSIPLIWEHLKPYQQQRVLTFVGGEESDRLGTGYQVFQSKVAIGSGGLFGKGYLQGGQKGLAFLPERHTDFIFSVVGEELGLVGALVVLGLFTLLIYRAVQIALKAKRPFASLMAVGVATYFAFQSCVNVSITVGLLPVTGMPLPLISYGGSSMLSSCIMMGLLLNASARWSEV